MTQIERPDKGFTELGYASQEAMDVNLARKDLETILESYQKHPNQTHSDDVFETLSDTLITIEKNKHLLGDGDEHKKKDLDALIEEGKSLRKRMTYSQDRDIEFPPSGEVAEGNNPKFNPVSTDNWQSDRMQTEAEKGPEEERE